jgi:hypothetical protein
MSDTLECIYRLVDQTLGELEWHEDDSCFESRIPLLGQTVSLDVYAGEGITDPSYKEQLQAVETARKYLKTLPSAEPTLKSRAAKQILQAARSYGLNGNHSQKECESDLKLHSLSLYASGIALHYRSPGLLPGLTTTVYCNKELICTSIEVYETHGI